MSKIKRSLAIVIGIDQYQHIPTLKNAVADAVGLADVLKNIYNYEVLLLLNQRATKAELDKLVANLQNKTILFDKKPIRVDQSDQRSWHCRDRVLFYFAGHGFAEEARDSESGKPAGYFMPQDAEPNNSDTWLSMQQLYESLSNLDCHHLLIILDCCFAGRISWIGQGRNAARSRKIYRQSYDCFIKHKTEQILTSAAHDEEAQDLSRFGQRGEKNGHSPFAHLLLKVLQGQSDGGKDKGIDAIIEDKVITVHELFAYLQNKLGEVAAEQTPGLSQPRKYDRTTGEYVYFKGEYIFPLPQFNPNNLKKLKLDKNTNPYKGLASFETRDRDQFFGRTTLTQQLKERITEQPLTVVLGASGSGKSSLVKAGLIPLLKTEFGQQQWHIFPTMRPSEHPFKALNRILTFSEKIEILFDYWLNRDSQAKLLIIIDQSEELLSLCQNRQEWKYFLDFLAQCLSKYRQRLHIVITLRSDFEPQLRDVIADTHWQETWQQGRFFVTPMNREELQQAIEEPAAQRTLFFESPRLVNRLIDEVINTPGALPLLSFTLSELYLKYLQVEENRERDDRTITEKDYEQLGGVTRSLTQAADKTYRKLLDKEKIDPLIIRNVMLRMVAVSGGELARRRVPESELIYPEAINEQVQIVITHFVEARLLTTGLDLEGQEYVEPVHDALVTGWQQILTWIQEKEESLMLQRRLTSAAEEWNKINSTEQLSDLQAKVEPAIDWLDRRFCALENWFARINTKLIRAKERSHYRQERSLAKPKQFLWNSNPYLDVLKKQLESQEHWFNQIETEFVRQSAIQKRRNISWRWRIAMGVILGLSGLFALATIFLGLSRINQAEVLRKSAEINLQENQSRDGMVESLESANILNGQGLQLLLLIKNLFSQTNLREQVRGTLLTAIYTVREIERQQEERGTVRASFSPDGQQIISSGENGNVRIWNLQGQTLSQSNSIDCGETCEPVKIARFSPDGRKIATAGANGTVRLWNVRDKELTDFQTWNTKQGEVKSISFNLNSQLLATTGANGTVILWNLQNNSIEKLKTFCVFGSCDRSDYGVVWSVEFSPDGRRLVCSGDNGTIRLWELEGKEWQEKIQFPSEENQTITSVSFSRNGQQLATAGKDGIVHVWDLSDGYAATFGSPPSAKQPREINTEQTEIWDVSFSPNPHEQKLATAGEDGNIILWDLNSQQLESDKLAGHQGPVRTVSFLPHDPQILSAGDDGSIRLWNLQGNELATFVVPISEAVSDEKEVIILDGTQKAIGRKDGTVAWQTSPGRKITMNSNHVNAVRSLAFSPDGKQLASGGQDRTIRLWNDNGQQEHLLPISSPVNSVAYSRDRKFLASAGEDGSVQLWNLQNLQDGRPFATWKADRGAVQKVRFSQDSQVLITTGEDSNTGSCKLWQIESFNNAIKQAEKRLNGYLENNPQKGDLSEAEALRDFNLCNEI